MKNHNGQKIAGKRAPSPAKKRDPGKTKRARRSSAEIRKSILRAARESFVSRGYAGTSTKAIADRARVHEPLLFRNFGSKAGLFEASVLESFDDYVHDHWQRFVNNTLPWSIAEQTDEYVKTLYALLMEKRELVIALFAANHELQGKSVPQPLESLFQILERMASAQYSKEGWTGIEIHYAVRFTFNLVLATVVFNDWVAPAAQNGSGRQDVADALVRYVLNGVMHRGVMHRSRDGSAAAKKPASRTRRKSSVREAMNM